MTDKINFVMYVFGVAPREQQQFPSLDVCLYLVGFEEWGDLQSVFDFLQPG